MIILWLVFFSLLFIFSFVVIFGAPYVPTLRSQQKIAIDLLKLKPNQVFYDLGCGDGRLLQAAAERGANAVGYEINPILAGIAWLRTRHHRSKVKVVCGNFWRADISDADAVYIFLVEHHMKRLDRFLQKQATQAKKSIKLASHGFKIPGRKVLAKQGAVFLYEY